MQNFKDKIKESQSEFQDRDNEQLQINQDEIATINDRSRRQKEEASQRHNELSENMQGYKEGLAASNKREAEFHSNIIEENKEELAKLKTFSKDYKNSAAYQDMIDNNNQMIEKTKEFNKRMSDEGLKKTEATGKKMLELKKKYRNQNQDLAEQEKEDIRRSTEYSDNLKEAIVKFNSRGVDQQVENAQEIADQMENFNNHEKARINTSQRSREEQYDKLQDIETHRSPKNPMNFGETELSKSYPQGVTEESSEEGRNTILRRIVVVGNKATEYKKVISVSGTFYFKNGLSTSKYVWDIESNKVLD